MISDIDKMISEEASPEMREVLLLVAEQSRATVALTKTVQQIAESFDEHRKEFIEHRDEFRVHVVEETTMLSWGLRVFSVTCSVLVFVVTAGGWYVGHHVIDVNTAQQVSIDVNSNRLTAIEALLRATQK